MMLRPLTVKNGEGKEGERGEGLEKKRKVQGVTVLEVEEEMKHQGKEGD